MIYILHDDRRYSFNDFLLAQLFAPVILLYSAFLAVLERLTEQ